jgi:hypothetical protein
MIYRGHVKNGVVILDENVQLPDGTAVDVQPIEQTPRKSIAERFKDFIGVVDDLPPDMAKNLDHYLYGTARHQIVSVAGKVGVCYSSARRQTLHYRKVYQCSNTMIQWQTLTGGELAWCVCHRTMHFP